MQKAHKDLLRTIVTQLRRLLGGYLDEHGDYNRGDLDRELERLGFAPTGRLMPLDGLRNPTPTQERAHRVVAAQLAALPADATAQAMIDLRNAIVERAAYSWINRLLALRTMEARRLIEETLRPSYDGVSEALFILRETEPQRTTGADGGWWAVVEDACIALTPVLPGLFDLTDPNTALRPSTPALLEAIKLVGGNHAALAKATNEAKEALFRDPDVIGWAYQFYQEEAKARVYAKLGEGGKVETRSEIAAATQLFTEPYMVQWMLQNSLGRTYHEAYPTSKLPESWAYYIRPEPTNESSSGPSVIFPLDQLTFLDIAMGSGHILREAFDMFFAMYREQYLEMAPDEIANRILTHHLHGIDIDPRAAQLAALTLVLRAYEQCVRPLTTGGLGRGLNLATTPTGLDSGALERHLARHPEDELYRPLLAGLFAALEQAPTLGSLLHPSDHLDKAITAFKSQHKGGQLALVGESANLNRLLDELARHDPAVLKAMLLENVSHSFQRDAQKSDVGALLMGREAVAGLHLLELLEQKYAVVTTNPPYMNSKNMNMQLKNYIELYYKEGKRDIATAFMIRCMQLCEEHGRFAMIPPQNWMFLQSFSELRIGGKLPSSSNRKETKFSGILKETSIESIAHLGRHAFSESDAPFDSAMFVIKKEAPQSNQIFWACRLTSPRLSHEQDALLQQAVKDNPLNSEYVFLADQILLRGIPDSPLVYWISPRFIELLCSSERLNTKAEIKTGIVTGDDKRFLRNIWEVVTRLHDWSIYAKGGGYSRWRGFEQWLIEWPRAQTPIRQNSIGRAKDHSYFGKIGWNYAIISRNGVSFRLLSKSSVYNNNAPTIFPSNKDFYLVGAILQTRLANFLLRVLSQSICVNAYYVGLLPYPLEYNTSLDSSPVVSSCLTLKEKIIANDLTEYAFEIIGKHLHSQNSYDLSIKLATWLHTFEGFLENYVQKMYRLEPKDINLLMTETGMPSGWYPLITNYDSLPDLPINTKLQPLAPEVLDYIVNHKRISKDPDELARIKTNLRVLYETGPGIKEVESVIGGEEEFEDSFSGAYIPIPSETFLEELSIKLQIHPISIYWLLEELRAAGIRCKPEEQRLLEDRLTVLTLRMLGHRWPKQIEAGEPVPIWADPDGIIPLTPGCGEATLVERLRERLRAEEGDLGAQRTEALLQELTGRTLADWLRRDFFKRHISQFKKRPIAWHLQSTPVAIQSIGRGKRRGVRPEPAFECLIYYHRCDTDILARIRTQYVEPLLVQEIRRQSEARRTLLSGVADHLSATGGEAETILAQTTARVQELQEFAERLRTVESQGFATPDLPKLLAKESLDRWSGDGRRPPVDHAAFVAQEQAWRVDLNDGVRVNIAPLQQAGLLAQEVLNRQDVAKALADRARWRADERRWVRQGKLPRCGWLDETMPESPKWTELAPEREAERRRLEEKRQQVLAELDKA